jgi:hypothetical protein
VTKGNGRLKINLLTVPVRVIRALKENFSSGPGRQGDTQIDTVKPPKKFYIAWQLGNVKGLTSRNQNDLIS